MVTVSPAPRGGATERFRFHRRPDQDIGSMRVRTLLLLCFVGSAALWLAACALLAWNGYQSRRTVAEHRMIEMARAVGAAIDGRLGSVRAALDVLSQSEALDAGDLAGVHRQAVALSRAWHGADVILADRDGLQLVNSFLPEPAPGVRRANPEIVRRVFEQGVPTVSDVFRGALTGRWLISIDMPVLRQGTILYDLSMTLPAQTIQDLIAAIPRQPGWYVAVIDRRGRVVARTDRPETFVGMQTGEALRATMRERPEGVAELRNLAGDPTILGFTAAGDTGWSVAVGIAQQRIVADTLNGLSGVLIGFGLLALLGSIGAVLIGQHLARAIGRLAGPAGALGRDEPVTAPRTGVTEIDGVGDALVQAARRLALHGRERDQAQQQLAAIMDHTVVGLVTTDRMGRVLTFNATAARMFGYSAAEVVGRPAALLVPEGTAGDPAGSAEVTGRRKDGSAFPIELSVGRLPAGAGDDVSVLTLRDITRRKAAEAQLRESEQRFREFALTASDWLWETDAERRVTYLSERFEALTGLDRARQMGHVQGPFGDPGTPGSDLARISAAIAAREPFANLRMLLPLGGGRSMWVRTSGRPRRAPDGSFLGYRGTASDITAEVQAQDQRQQEQKLAALGRLAGGVAHDFNNALAAILGFGEMLAEDLAAGSEEHDSATQIVGAARRARDLVRQILAFARAASEQRRPLPLAATLQEMRPAVAGALPARTRLELRVEDPSVWVLANDSELSQIVTNLCVNASDALGAAGGSVILRVGRAGPGDWGAPPGGGWARVAAGAVTDVAGMALVEIADEGAGIAPELIGKVLEPFFTTKARGSGTGLGLAVVHGLVGAMGGVLEVVSKPGAGTRIRLFLPAVAAAESAEPPPPPVAPPRGAGRVLVAEDNVGVNAMTRLALRRLGYAASGAEDGAAALAAFTAAPDGWDLLLTDLAMPGLDGMALIAAVKRQRPDLPCVLMTGHLEHISVDEAHERGADALLRKPFGQETLARLLSRFVGGPAGAAVPASDAAAHSLAGGG